MPAATTLTAHPQSITTSINRHSWRLVACLLPPVLGLILFSSSGRDDSHITFWVAKHLAETGGLVNYNGEAVEQSSSLLHVLLLSISYRVLPLKMPIIGALCSLAAASWLVWLTDRLRQRVMPHQGAFVVVVLGCSAPLAYWSVGGLETTLAAAVYVLVILTWEQTLRTGTEWGRLSLATAAAIAVRPEAIAVLLCTLIVCARLGDRSMLKRLGGLGAITLLLFALLAAWRLQHFGSAFPQPVTAKAGGLRLGALLDGVRYGKDEILQRWELPLWITAAIGVVIAIRSRRSIAIALVVAFVGSAGLFVVASGGDWMEGGRFLVPLLPMVVIVAAMAVGKLATNLRRIAATGLVVTTLFGTIALARTRSTGSPIWTSAGDNPAQFSWFEQRNRVHQRDVLFIDHLNATIATLLRHRRRVTLLTGHMGMVPFYVADRFDGRVTFLDQYSLTSRVFTDCPVTKHAARGRFGMFISYEELVSSNISTACGTPRPDIVFGQDAPVVDRELRLVDEITQAGYPIIYKQSGELLENGSHWLPGDNVRANQFIAVRADLLAEF